jgi:hypothetical protein
MNGQLTTNFSLHEFLRSDVATRLGRPIDASPDITVRLLHVAQVLQWIRDDIKAELGVEHTFTISSGYRPMWLNTLIGGAPKSDHMDGRAADFEVIGMTVFDVCKFIEARIAKYDIDKLIYEFGEWTHISVPPPGSEPRRLIMTAVRNSKGVVEYPLGIIKKEET